MREGKGIREGETSPFLFLVTEITFHVTYLGREGELVELEQLNHYMQRHTWGNRFLRARGTGTYSYGASADKEHR